MFCKVQRSLWLEEKNRPGGAGYSGLIFERKVCLFVSLAIFDSLRSPLGCLWQSISLRSVAAKSKSYGANGFLTVTPP